MTSSNLSQDTIFGLLQSQEEFPVNFDDAWKWYGLSTKGNAKKSFERVGFTEGTDYTVIQLDKRVKGNNGGGSVRYEEILLTCDCFKTWGMTLTTEKGKEVRKYFIDCEKALKAILKNVTASTYKSQAQVDLERLEERLKLKNEARLALTDVCKEWMECRGWYSNRPRVGKYFAELFDGMNLAVTTETSKQMLKRLSEQRGTPVKSDELIRDYFPVEALRLYLSVHTVLTNTLLDLPINQRDANKYLTLAVKLALPKAFEPKRISFNLLPYNHAAQPQLLLK